jgi:putative endonuclease
MVMLNTICFYVYILTNKQRTVLYTGVTNDLKQRVEEHYSQRGQKSSFTGKYHTYYLLYFEAHQYINNAIAREKEIKGWVREKKMKLINEMNPSLRFLNEEVFGVWPPEEIESRLKS